jgi:hypothetical membrane protein
MTSRINIPLSLRRVLRDHHALLTAGLALLAVMGVMYFFAAVAAAEALRPMYDPVQRTISELAVGRYDYLQISAFVALGLSLVALPAGLWQRMRRTVLSRVGIGLVASGGVASLVAAAFPTDLRGATFATLAGHVHNITAGTGYACLITAMLLLSLHFRGDAQWRSYHRLSLVLTALGVVALLGLAAAGGGDFAGLVQRLMAIPLLSWVMLTGMRAARLTPLGASTDPSR